MRTVFRGLVVALLTLTLLGGASAVGASAPKTLKIGSLVALTEWFSVFDILQDREVKAVAQIINEAGGITVKGEKYNIELVTEDYKSSLDGVAAAANRLVYDKKVKFVVGPLGFFATASSPIFEQNKVLHVSTWVTCQPGEMDAKTPFGFLGYHAAIGEFVGTIKALKKFYPNVKKLTFLHPDDGAIPYLMPKVKKLAEDAGYTVVGDTVGYPNEMADFSPVAAKLNAIKDTDAYCFINGVPPHIGSLVKCLRQLGNNKLVIREGNINCNDIAAIAGKAAATNVLTGGITPGPDNPPMVNEIYKRLKAQYGDNSLNLENASGLYVLAQVIEAAQSLDPAAVKKKWESMDTVKTLFGKGYVGGGQKTYGINHAISNPHSIQRLIDGKVVSGGWVEVGPIP